MFAVTKEAYSLVHTTNLVLDPQPYGLLSFTVRFPLLLNLLVCEGGDTA